MMQTTSLAGSKRPLSSPMDESLAKKRATHHSLHYRQQIPVNLEPAPQSPIYAQGQLLKSVSAALKVAGFDGVDASALEMFRSHAEEYMLKFLGYVKTSMHGARRSRATAADFTSALSLMPNSANASRLQPQLSLSLPEGIAYPSIPEPDPEPAQAPDFSNLLSSLVDTTPKKYIPQHFPLLPSRHAWVETPVFPEREVDPRKMRERATQEGMLAEQALRKLAAAAKAGAMKAERDRNSVLRGPGKARNVRKIEKSEEVFSDLLRDIGASHEAEDAEKNMAITTSNAEVDVGMPEGVVVNYDIGHWRRNGNRRALRI